MEIIPVDSLRESRRQQGGRKHLLNSGNLHISHVTLGPREEYNMEMSYDIIYYILDGKGVLRQHDIESEVSINTLVKVPKNTTCYLINTTSRKLDLLELTTPTLFPLRYFS